jgi:hypothetical protein
MSGLTAIGIMRCSSADWVEVLFLELFWFCV